MPIETESQRNERILEQAITDYRLIKGRETLEDAKLRFRPKVLLCKPCMNFQYREHINKLDLSQMLPKAPQKSEFIFRGRILFKSEFLNSSEAKYRVRWMPEGLLDDEDISCANCVGLTKLEKKIKISDFKRILEQRQKEILIN